jgi:hypothetical protein
VVKTQVVSLRTPGTAALIVVVLLAGACGSTSHSPIASPTSTSAPVATTAPSATTAAPSATTAAPSVTAPADTAPLATPATTTSAPSTSAPSTSAPTTTTPSNPATARAAARYKAIIGPGNAAGTRFSGPFEAFYAGKGTHSSFMAAVARYVVAQIKLQAQLAAGPWPAAVETVIRRIIAVDKVLVMQLDRLTTVAKSKVKASVNGVLRTLAELKTLSGQVRKDLGLPPNG